MSDRPRFTAAPRPTIPGFPHMTDVAGSPACEVCGAHEPLDDGLCLVDWRVVVLAPWALRAKTPTAGVCPVPGGCIACRAPDELATIRESREVPRLTDAAGSAGVSLDVALEPPSNLGKPRRRT